MTARFLIIILSFSIILSCTEKKADHDVTVLPRIENKEVLLSYDNCIIDSLRCTHVQFQYPHFTDTANQDLNGIILAKIKQTTSSYFREETIDGSLEFMASRFIEDFQSFLIDFPEYAIGWYVKVFSEITYESEEVLSLKIYSESFTGGAHPNSNTSFCVVDKRSGEDLEVSKIVADTTAFKLILEKEFKAQ